LNERLANAGSVGRGHIEACPPLQVAVHQPLGPGLEIIGRWQVVPTTWPPVFVPPRHAAPMEAPEQPAYGARPHSPSEPQAEPGSVQTLPEQHASPTRPHGGGVVHVPLTHARPALHVVPPQHAWPEAPHAVVALPGTQKGVMPGGPPQVKPGGQVLPAPHWR
jgi:hypothetical protein